MDERVEDLQTRRLRINLRILPGMSVVESFSLWIWSWMCTFYKCVVRCRGNMNCIHFIPSLKFKAHGVNKKERVVREGFHGRNPHAVPKWREPTLRVARVDDPRDPLQLCATQLWGTCQQHVKNNMLPSLGSDMLRYPISVQGSCPREKQKSVPPIPTTKQRPKKMIP